MALLNAAHFSEDSFGVVAVVLVKVVVPGTGVIVITTSTNSSGSMKVSFLDYGLSLPTYTQARGKSTEKKRANY